MGRRTARCIPCACAAVRARAPRYTLPFDARCTTHDARYTISTTYPILPYRTVSAHLLESRTRAAAMWRRARRCASRLQNFTPLRRTPGGSACVSQVHVHALVQRWVSGQRSVVSGQRSAVSGLRSAVSFCDRWSAVCTLRSSQRSPVSALHSARSGFSPTLCIGSLQSAVCNQRSALYGQRRRERNRPPPTPTPTPAAASSRDPRRARACTLQRCNAMRVQTRMRMCIPGCGAGSGV